MPEYRLFHFKGEHVERADHLLASDDLEAVHLAKPLAEEQTAELWRGARKIKVFNPAI
jgi:hypothetical protein